jgi:hypothetical protein
MERYNRKILHDTLFFFFLKIQIVAAGNLKNDGEKCARHTVIFFILFFRVVLIGFYEYSVVKGVHSPLELKFKTKNLNDIFFKY